MIKILDGEVDLTSLRDAWLASLRGAGLDGTGAGWDVRSGDEVGLYVAKWGAAEELTLSQHKKGRGRTGRTPAQLLAASCDEADRSAGRLWAEYATVFQGRRQLVWSRGLKERAGIDQVDDAEAAKDQGQEGQEEIARANIEHMLWRNRVASKRSDLRAALLDHAEEVGPAAAVEDLFMGRIEALVNEEITEAMTDSEEVEPPYVSHEEMSEMPEGIEVEDPFEETLQRAVERRYRLQQGHEVGRAVGGFERGESRP